MCSVIWTRFGILRRISAHGTLLTGYLLRRTARLSFLRAVLAAGLLLLAGLSAVIEDLATALNTVGTKHYTPFVGYALTRMTAYTLRRRLNTSTTTRLADQAKVPTRCALLHLQTQRPL